MTATVAEVRSARWGLAAKLFAVLLLLGVVAVVVTSVLGYIRAREALEKVIFDQLISARETKANQVEAYFRTIRSEMRLLAFDTRAFKTLLEEMPKAHDRVMEILAARLRARE